MSLKNIVDPIIPPGLDVQFKSVDTSTSNVINEIVDNLTVNNKLFVKSGKTTIGTPNPNTNSNNDLDVYGLLGMSLANANTYYGFNIYFDGSTFRALRNGYSALIKCDNSGNLIFNVSAASNLQDAVVGLSSNISMNSAGIFTVNNRIKCSQSYLQYRNTVAQSIIANAPIPTQFNTQDVSVGSGIQFVTNAFNVLQNGIYNINWTIQWANNSSGFRRTYVFTSSGLIYGDISNVPDNTTGISSLSSSCTIKLNATEGFQILVFQSSPGALNTTAQSFSVYQLPSLF